MNALVELIKRIAVFMIAAQAVIHFAPDIKYAKYMKLIMGIMILLQFLSPIYGIVTGIEEDLAGQLSNPLQEQERYEYGLSEDFSDSYSTIEAVTKNMEIEIKSRLNNELLNDNTGNKYEITNVIIELKTGKTNNENTTEYTLGKVRVAVWENTEYNSGMNSEQDTDSETGTMYTEGAEDTDDDNVNKVEKIHIDKIDIAENGIEKNDNRTSDSLRRRFCSVLGMEEEYMEVIVYGVH